MIDAHVQASAVQHQAFEASEAFVEIAVSVENSAAVETAVKMGTVASVASVACVVCLETVASGKGKRAADLVAMFLLAHLVESSIEVNVTVLGTRAN
jgi:hypothetical protein